MSLRIAWACHPTNVSLGIAAQIFVYVGTIILYLCNWLFAQRVIRAQHPQFGWSTAYRVIHRGGMVALLVALIMIITTSIQQFFTVDNEILRLDRDIQLAGFTYFAAFTVAPLVLLALSLIVPRKNTEKFGAGRLRNAIAILIAGTSILAIGQCYRTIVGWLPPVPVRNAQGQFNASPWYLSKASFYCFNLLTELLVVIFYAVMRVDLRFHVADGAKQPGDYRRFRESQISVELLAQREKMKRNEGNLGSVGSNKSYETMKDVSSTADDSRNLAESLRFSSHGSGHSSWVSKRQSSESTTRPTPWDPTNSSHASEPPVPPLPNAWPLRDPLSRPTSIRTAPSLTPIRPSRPPSTIPEEPMHSSTSDLPLKNIYKPESDLNRKKTFTPGFPPSPDIPYRNIHLPASPRASSASAAAPKMPRKGGSPVV